MAKRKVTLSIESQTYSDFKKYCEDNAVMLSKKVEIFMDNFMKHSKQKRNVYSFFALFFGIILMINFASADNLLLKPNSTVGVDAFIRSADPNKNQGVTTNLEVKSASGDIRVLLYFNLSNLSSNIVVSNATLTLYRESGADNNPALVGVYRINNSWTEGSGDGSITNDGATWNSRNGSVSWDSSGGDFSSVVFDAINISGNGFYVFSLTNLIRGWVNGTWSNYGLILSYVNSGETRKVFTSSDGSNSTNWPALNITYSVVDSTPPASITNLVNRSAGTTWIYWNWTNPSDADFNATIVYLNGLNVANTSNNYYNATGLTAGTNYTLRANTKDTTGNINYTNVTSIASTLDSCTPNLTNTSWTAWYDTSVCYINDTKQQTRNLTQYDANSCGGANQTFYEYQSAVCDYCNYNVTNTTWSDWQNETGCLANNTQQQNRSKTEYDANYGTCYLVTGLASDLWNSGNNKTYWEEQSAACSGVCGDAVCQSDESCSLCSADCGSCSSSGGGGGGTRRVAVVNNTNSSASVFVFGVPGISIDSLDLIAANPGENRKMSINVKNSGTAYLNKCKLEGEGNYSWLVFSGVKDLSIGQMSEFVAELKIPDDAKPGSYSLEFSINCSELAKSSKLDVEIIKKKLILELIDATRDENGNIAISYSLAEMTGETQEVSVELVMLDLKGLRVAEATERRVIEPHSRTDFDSLLNLGEDVSGGNFNLLINANSKVASAFVQEYVVFDRKSISGLAIIGGEDKISKIIIAIMAAAFFLFALFIIRRIFYHKRMGEKRKVSNALVSHFRPLRVK